jgi:ElaB/YqjD/DUF883 family membrane-anchored ribosome-binding protein
MERAVKRQRKNQEILRRSRQYYVATVALANNADPQTTDRPWRSVADEA